MAGGVAWCARGDDGVSVRPDDLVHELSRRGEEAHGAEEMVETAGV